MFMRAGILRFLEYYKHHGLASTLKRTWREIMNRLFHNRLILYWLDLANGDFQSHPLPASFRVERYDHTTGMPDLLFERIAEHYSRKLQWAYILRRLNKGAILWRLMEGNDDVGYIWTLEGAAMTPHYFFPLLPRDIHFDDGFIFPKYRGHGLFFSLNNYILRHYQLMGFQRAYLEVAEWNDSSKHSVIKNGFVPFGLAWMRSHGDRCLVKWWYRKENSPCFTARSSQ